MDEKETMLKCPYCGIEEIHIQAVKVNRNGEVTVVDRDGTKMRSESPSGRGARVELTLWCEGGHKWRHSLQFHKGNVFVENEVLIDGCPTCLEAFTSDLWRD